MFEQLEGKSAEPVAVANDNLFDIPAQHPVQKGDQTGTSPVDARTHVFDDLVSREGDLQRFDLAIEVGLLFLAGDSRVADPRSRFGRLADLAELAFGGVADKSPLDVGKPVEPLAGLAPEPDGCQSSGVAPAAERVVADAEPPPDGNRGDVSIVASIHNPRWCLKKFNGNSLFMVRF